MAHTPAKLRELFASECRFPADRGTVLDAVGDERIHVPNGDAVTVADVLAHGETAHFETVDELQSTVQANLDADHVGRTEYDDRSPNPERDDDESF